MKILDLLTLCLLLCGLLWAKEKQRYVPIPCLQNLVISDWGKCKTVGDQVDCPNMHGSYRIGCTSLNPGPSSGDVKVTRPTAVLIEDPE